MSISKADARQLAIAYEAFQASGARLHAARSNPESLKEMKSALNHRHVWVGMLERAQEKTGIVFVDDDMFRMIKRDLELQEALYAGPLTVSD